MEAFQQASLSSLWISAVVLYEVLVGARDEPSAEGLERWFIRPFHDRRRILVPQVTTWRLAARTNRALRTKKFYTESLRKSSVQNDILIAASCREAGATLITANAKNFSVIRSVIGMRYLTAFPTTQSS